MKTLFAVILLSFAAVRVAAAGAPESPKKVLFFTKSSGFIHDAIKPDGEKGHGYAFRVLTAIGARENIVFTFSKDGALFTPEYLAQFDAFVFYTSGDLTLAKSDPRGDGLAPMNGRHLEPIGPRAVRRHSIAVVKEKARKAHITLIIGLVL